MGVQTAIGTRNTGYANVLGVRERDFGATARKRALVLAIANGRVATASCRGFKSMSTLSSSVVNSQDNGSSGRLRRFDL